MRQKYPQKTAYPITSSIMTAKKSIHDRLGEKKQQSVAKKAEKAMNKAVKKDKGQEL